MEPLWKFVQAEALDAAQAPATAKVTKAVIVVELEHSGGYQELQITHHYTGRALRPSEASGLLARALGRAVDS